MQYKKNRQSSTEQAANVQEASSKPASACWARGSRFQVAGQCSQANQYQTPLTALWKWLPVALLGHELMADLRAGGNCTCEAKKIAGWHT